MKKLKITQRLLAFLIAEFFFYSSVLSAWAASSDFLRPRSSVSSDGGIRHLWQTFEKKEIRQSRDGANREAFARLSGISEEQIGILFPSGRTPHLIPDYAQALYDTSERVRQLYQEASSVSGYSVEHLLTVGDRKDAILYRVASTLYAVALYEALEEHLGQPFWPRFLAGSSVGSLAAMVASDALSLEGAITYGMKTAPILEELSTKADYAMFTVLGAQYGDVAEWIEPGSIELIMDASPAYVVLAVSGGLDLKRLKEEMTQKTGKKIRSQYPPLLKAPHTSFYAAGKERVENIVDTLTIRPPKIPIVSASSKGEILTDAEGVRRELKEELFKPVLWSDALHYMAENGIEAFLEFNSGMNDTHFNQTLLPGKTTVNVDRIDLAGAVAETIRLPRNDSGAQDGGDKTLSWEEEELVTYLGQQDAPVAPSRIAIELFFGDVTRVGRVAQLLESKGLIWHNKRGSYYKVGSRAEPPLREQAENVALQVKKEVGKKEEGEDRLQAIPVVKKPAPSPESKTPELPPGFIPIPEGYIPSKNQLLFHQKYGLGKVRRTVHRTKTATLFIEFDQTGKKVLRLQQSKHLLFVRGGTKEDLEPSAKDGGSRRYPSPEDPGALEAAKTALAERTQQGWSNNANAIQRGEHPDKALYNLILALERRAREKGETLSLMSRKRERRPPRFQKGRYYPSPNDPGALAFVIRELEAREKKGLPNHPSGLYRGEHTDDSLYRLARALERREEIQLLPRKRVIYRDWEGPDALEKVKGELKKRTRKGWSNLPHELQRGEHPDNGLYRKVAALEKELDIQILPRERQRRFLDTLEGWRAYLDRRITEGKPITHSTVKTSVSSEELRRLYQFERRHGIRLVLRKRSALSNFNEVSKELGALFWNASNPDGAFLPDRSRTVQSYLSQFAWRHQLMLLFAFRENDRFQKPTEAFLQTKEGQTVLAGLKQEVVKEVGPMVSWRSHRASMPANRVLAWIIISPSGATDVLKTIRQNKKLQRKWESYLTTDSGQTLAQVLMRAGVHSEEVLSLTPEEKEVMEHLLEVATPISPTRLAEELYAAGIHGNIGAVENVVRRLAAKGVRVRKTERGSFYLEGERADPTKKRNKASKDGGEQTPSPSLSTLRYFPQEVLFTFP